MINERDIKWLKPRVQTLANAFIAECELRGIDILITSTYRDCDTQDALYAQGRTKPGKIVTNAKGGYSFHNFAVAFDFVPMVSGKPAWNDTALFKKCGEIAESVGLEWAGRWKKFPEMAHCQYTGGLTLADFRDGKDI